MWSGMRAMGLIGGKNKDLPVNISNVEDINNNFVQSVPDIPPDNDFILFHSDRDNCAIPCNFFLPP